MRRHLKRVAGVDSAIDRQPADSFRAAAKFSDDPLTELMLVLAIAWDAA